MSQHHHHTEITPDYFSKSKAKGLAALSGIAGVILLAGSFGFGLLTEGRFDQLAFSWLFAIIYFFTLACGSLFWIFVHHATDAEWSVVVRRQLENITAVFPVLLVIFFSGIVFFAPRLFSWWTLPAGVDSFLDHKAGYLNHKAFYIRAAFYFVAMSFLAYSVRRLSVKQDEDGAARNTVRCRFFSFIGIPVLGLSLTFAAVDWLMALDFHWFSTMWGVYIFAGGAGSAISLLVLVLSALRKAGHLQIINQEHYHILGKLMLAFCVFWAYIGFSQYMLIWYANIPEETIYFVRRTTGTWWSLSLILVIGRFFLPFPFLLFQGTKKNPKVLCMVAGWLLVMQAVDLYIIIFPMLHQRGISFSPLDITMLLGVGGVLASVFFSVLAKSSLFPTRDPRTVESINLSN